MVEISNMRVRLTHWYDIAALDILRRQTVYTSRARMLMVTAVVDTKIWTYYLLRHDFKDRQMDTAERYHKPAGQKKR